jgi:hypothetical protein
VQLFPKQMLDLLPFAFSLFDIFSEKGHNRLRISDLDGKLIRTQMEVRVDGFACDDARPELWHAEVQLKQKLYGLIVSGPDCQFHWRITKAVHLSTEQL